MAFVMFNPFLPGTRVLRERSFQKLPFASCFLGMEARHEAVIQVCTVNLIKIRQGKAAVHFFPVVNKNTLLASLNSELQYVLPKLSVEDCCLKILLEYFDQ